MGEEIRKREGRGQIERDGEKRREGALPPPNILNTSMAEYELSE